MESNEPSHQKSNNCEQVNRNDEKKECIKPLDGGWGYVIVIGSFFINFICKYIIPTGHKYFNQMKEFIERNGSCQNK